MARLLGADGAGLFFLALTVTMIGTVVGRLGLDHALLRFVAAGAGAGDWSEVRGANRKSMALAVAASAFAAALLFAAAPFLAERVFSKPGLAGPLRATAVALLPLALLTLHAEALRGVKRIFVSQAVQGAALPALALPLVWLLGSAGGPAGAAWGYAAAAAAVAAVAHLLWRRATPHLAGFAPRFPTRLLLRTSLPLFWVASMALLMSWTGTLLLGVWGTAAEVGIFTVAARTAMLTSLVLVAVNSIAAPKFAELYRLGDLAALDTTARRSAALTVLLASRVLLAFVAAPRLVMGLFGAEFREGGLLLTILAVGQFVNVATGSVGYLLIMSGHEKDVRNNTAFAALLNLGLSVALIPAWGRVGAAVATATGVAALNLGAVYLAWRRLGILTIPVGSLARAAPKP